MSNTREGLQMLNILYLLNHAGSRYREICYLIENLHKDNIKPYLFTMKQVYLLKGLKT